jgi:hypothetical protein
MDVEWDEEKSEANYRARGFDLSFATLIFGGPTLEKEDRRRDYGEERVIAVGWRMASPSLWFTPIGS